MRTAEQTQTATDAPAAEGFLVEKASGMYLERIPFNGTYEFIAMDPKHATVFSRERAELLAAERGAFVVADRAYERAPKDI